MKRMLPQLLCAIAIAGLSNAPVHGAATHKIVHAATSATPIVIAVLSDHYTDEGEFDLDVANFITYGLIAHPFYADHAADLQIESFYEPVTSGAASNYGFDVEVPSQDCVISWSDANTSSSLDAVVGGINPFHTIVIGDHPYNVGCTNGGWTYVGVDAVGTDVLPHELGHGLAALYDEWFPEDRAGQSHPGIPLADSRNCYDTRHGTPPPWVGAFSGAGSVRGCDLFDLDVVHAFPHEHDGHFYCLMGARPNSEFCPVCGSLMEAAFEYVRNPDAENPESEQRAKAPAPPSNVRIQKVAFVQQPAPAPPATRQPASGVILKPGETRPILRLIASFNPETGTLTAKRGVSITARYTPSHRRLGEYAYEILEANRVIDVGVFPSTLFRSRNYAGGTQHGTSAPHTVDVTIQIPDVTAEAMKDPARAISIRIWRLMPNVTDRLITPAVLARLRDEKRAEPRGELSATQIRSVM